METNAIFLNILNNNKAYFLIIHKNFFLIFIYLFFDVPPNYGRREHMNIVFASYNHFKKKKAILHDYF